MPDLDGGVVLGARRSLSRMATIAFLDRLRASAEAAVSLYAPSGLSLPQTEDLFSRALYPQKPPAPLVELAARSKTGAALFLAASRSYLVLPPFPITSEQFASGFAVEPLLSMLKADFRIALVLVRLGAYAIGVCQGEGLVSSKVGTGLVHGRHRQGGSSQQRFRRHREKQIEGFLTRVCLHVREQLEPQAKSLDYLVYGGAWTTILELQKECPLLHRLDKPLLPPLLDIPAPNQAVLEKAVGRVWSSSVIEVTPRGGPLLSILR